MFSATVCPVPQLHKMTNANTLLGVLIKTLSHIHFCSSCTLFLRPVPIYTRASLPAGHLLLDTHYYAHMYHVTIPPPG